MPVWRFAYDDTPMPVSYVMGRTDSEGYYSGGTHKLTESVKASLNTEPVLKAALAMTLKTIQWPTGGYTDFKYELNDYSKALAEGHTSVIDVSGTSGGLRIADRHAVLGEDGLDDVREYVEHLGCGGEAEAHAERETGYDHITVAETALRHHSESGEKDASEHHYRASAEHGVNPDDTCEDDDRGDVAHEHRKHVLETERNGLSYWNASVQLINVGLCHRL